MKKNLFYILNILFFISSLAKAEHAEHMVNITIKPTKREFSGTDLITHDSNNQIFTINKSLNVNGAELLKNNKNSKTYKTLHKNNKILLNFKGKFRAKSLDVNKRVASYGNDWIPDFGLSKNSIINISIDPPWNYILSENYNKTKVPELLITRLKKEIVHFDDFKINKYSIENDSIIKKVTYINFFYDQLFNPQYMNEINIIQGQYHQKINDNTLFINETNLNEHDIRKNILKYHFKKRNYSWEKAVEKYLTEYIFIQKEKDKKDHRLHLLNNIKNNNEKWDEYGELLLSYIESISSRTEVLKTLVHIINKSKNKEISNAEFEKEIGTINPFIKNIMNNWNKAPSLNILNSKQYQLENKHHVFLNIDSGLNSPIEIVADFYDIKNNVTRHQIIINKDIKSNHIFDNEIIKIVLDPDFQLPRHLNTNKRKTINDFLTEEIKIILPHSSLNKEDKTYNHLIKHLNKKYSIKNKEKEHLYFPIKNDKIISFGVLNKYQAEPIFNDVELSFTIQEKENISILHIWSTKEFNKNLLIRILEENKYYHSFFIKGEKTIKSNFIPTKPITIYF